MSIRDLADSDLAGRIAFAVGTGRCGTQFLQRVLATEPGVAACHERNRINETFHRYCQWYRLPVDKEGFLQEKEKEIRQDLVENNFSFESSSYLSLSIPELYDRFGAKFVMLVRRPDRVVNSLWVKGWYREPYIQADPEKALGYQPQPMDHHFFSRIAPMGAIFEPWNKMSRIGKIAWFWNAINLAIAEQFAKIPETHWRIVKLEDLSYNTYLELTEFMGFESAVPEERYREIASGRPNALPKRYAITDWSDAEISEFEAQVQPGAEHFGYEYRVSNLPLPSPPEAQEPAPQETNLVRGAWQKLGRKSKGILKKLKGRALLR
ncbi:MAG: hypothetical protein F6J93_37805 [Oscillatoria sp. SIO1A7]|nr:hypothetical protein [Oscillatoria sp. SIO1A7]